MSGVHTIIGGVISGESMGQSQYMYVKYL